VKSRFYKSLNSVCHRAGRVRNELVTLHLVSAYCRPHLLYVTESLNLSATEIRSLQHTWQCAISHIFKVSGQNVNFVCGIMDDKSLDIQIIERRINFVKDMHKYHSHHAVLCKLYMWCGKNELASMA